MAWISLCGMRLLCDCVEDFSVGFDGLVYWSMQVLSCSPRSLNGRIGVSKGRSSLLFERRWV
jgi:hypothetical protein